MEWGGTPHKAFSEKLNTSWTAETIETSSPISSYPDSWKREIAEYLCVYGTISSELNLQKKILSSNTVVASNERNVAQNHDEEKRNISRMNLSGWLNALAQASNLCKIAKSSSSLQKPALWWVETQFLIVFENLTRDNWRCCGFNCSHVFHCVIQANTVFVSLFNQHYWQRWRSLDFDANWTSSLLKFWADWIKEIDIRSFNFNRVWRPKLADKVDVAIISWELLRMISTVFLHQSNIKLFRGIHSFAWHEVY